MKRFFDKTSRIVFAIIAVLCIMCITPKSYAKISVTQTQQEKQLIKNAKKDAAKKKAEEEKKKKAEEEKKKKAAAEKKAKEEAARKKAEKEEREAKQKAEKAKKDKEAAAKKAAEEKKKKEEAARKKAEKEEREAKQKAEKAKKDKEAAAKKAAEEKKKKEEAARKKAKQEEKLAKQKAEKAKKDKEAAKKAAEEKKKAEQEKARKKAEQEEKLAKQKAEKVKKDKEAAEKAEAAKKAAEKAARKKLEKEEKEAKKQENKVKKDKEAAAKIAAEAKKKAEENEKAKKEELAYKKKTAEDRAEEQKDGYTIIKLKQGTFPIYSTKKGSLKNDKTKQGVKSLSGKTINYILPTDTVIKEMENDGSIKVIVCRENKNGGIDRYYGYINETSEDFNKRFKEESREKTHVPSYAVTTSAALNSMGAKDKVTEIKKGKNGKLIFTIRDSGSDKTYEKTLKANRVTVYSNATDALNEAAIKDKTAKLTGEKYSIENGDSFQVLSNDNGLLSIRITKSDGTKVTGYMESDEHIQQQKEKIAREKRGVTYNNMSLDSFKQSASQSNVSSWRMNCDAVSEYYIEKLYGNNPTGISRTNPGHKVYSAEELKAAIDNGQMARIHVAGVVTQRNPSGTHWVVVVGYKGSGENFNDYIFLDSWNGKVGQGCFQNTIKGLYKGQWEAKVLDKK